MTIPAWRTDATADEVHAALKSILGNTDSIFVSNDEMRNALNLWTIQGEWRNRVSMFMVIDPDGSFAMQVTVQLAGKYPDGIRYTNEAWSCWDLRDAPIEICKAWLWAYEQANEEVTQ